MRFQNREWAHFALCKDAPTEEFFVDTKNLKAVEKVKKAYCRPCPVRMECLQYALETDSEGIWGGMTDGERYQYRLFSSVWSVQLTTVTVAAVSYNASPDEMPHEQERRNGARPFVLFGTVSVSTHTLAPSGRAVAAPMEFWSESPTTSTHQSPEMCDSLTNQMLHYGPSVAYSGSPLQPVHLENPRSSRESRRVASPIQFQCVPATVS